MAGWLVVAADFLLDPHDRNGIPAGVMDEDAMRVVRSFADWRSRMVLVGEEPADVLKHWALTRGLAHWDDVQGDEPSLLEAARVKRDHYGGVRMVLAGDPADVRGLLLHGFKVLSVATPLYVRDDHRPDFEDSVRPWSEVADQYTGDRALHEADERRKQDDSESARFTS